MPTFTSPVDGAALFYRYYQPDEIAFRKLERKTSDVTLVWLHGWPMSSRMYEHLILPLCESYRFRCIAPDRRGFGKSEWSTPKTGSIGYDTFVADLVALLQHLDVKNFVLVGASMGSAESLKTYLQSPFVQERCKVRENDTPQADRLANNSPRASSG
jgi:pimeloyl-ACP methyl ester carboxylesterase